MNLDMNHKCKNLICNPDFSPKKSIYWQNSKPTLNRSWIGLGFWYRNQQTFKIFDNQKCLGLKIYDFFENS